MKTQDDDLDRLFSAKLADMEIVPDETVWNYIAMELESATDNKKRTWPFMRIAAGIVVVMGFSLFLFRPHNHQVLLHGDGSVAYSTTSNTVGQISQPVVNQGKSTVVKQKVAVSHSSGQPDFVRNEAKLTAREDEQYRAALAEVARNNQLNNTHPAMLQRVNPIVDVPVNKVANVDTPVKPLNILTADIEKDQKGPIFKRKKIHSLGDILNVVIAKVDKRDDKIIEFTNTRNEDDSFTITGINFGLIKAKKQ